MANEIVPSKVQTELDTFSPEEMDSRIREALFDWIDSDQKLDPTAKEALIARGDQLRLKFQTLFIEFQKHTMRELLIDAEAEAELRREMRLNIPFMDATERANTLKALASTYEDRLERLERQMAGWDLFSNSIFALQSSSETRVPLEMSEKVKALTPARRRQLLNIIEDIKTEIDKVEETNVKPDPA
jgi:hypothetical protein